MADPETVMELNQVLHQSHSVSKVMSDAHDMMKDILGKMNLEKAESDLILQDAHALMHGEAVDAGSDPAAMADLAAMGAGDLAKSGAAKFL